MPTYRAYLIDGDDRVASFRPVVADTDAEALEAARQFVDGCAVEVWHLDRKIGRLGRAGDGLEPFCTTVRRGKTPPLSEDADGVSHALTLRTWCNNHVADCSFRARRTSQPGLTHSARSRRGTCASQNLQRHHKFEMSGNTGTI